jgi:AraC-like DNA-binding protein
MPSVHARSLTRYRAVQFGVETLPSGLALPRHRHSAGHATVVLAGSFEEASFAGHFVVAPGDVLLHGAFDCHVNRPSTRGGLQIVRLPWDDQLTEGHFRVRDADLLARLSQRDLLEALETLRNDLIQIPTQELHWTDRLARSLRLESEVRLDAWAELEGLTPETLSRGFRRVFGVTPKEFRLETRARRGWMLTLRTSAPLTHIAHETGFADLPHLSRSISALTGASPSFWREHGVADGLARGAYTVPYLQS